MIDRNCYFCTVDGQCTLYDDMAYKECDGCKGEEEETK